MKGVTPSRPWSDQEGMNLGLVPYLKKSCMNGHSLKPTWSNLLVPHVWHNSVSQNSMKGVNRGENSPSPRRWLQLPINEMVAGFVSYLPVHRLFVLKNAEQLGIKVDPFKFFKNLDGAVRSGFSFSALVCAQYKAQKASEKYLAENFDLPKTDWKAKCASTMFVSLAASPFLSGFNGLNMTPRMPFHQGFFRIFLSPKQFGAIYVQEFGFLGGLVFCEPLSDEMKKRFGNNYLVQTIAYMASGLMGAASGHAGNTYLTFLQKGKKVENLSQLMTLGLKQRSVGVMLLNPAFYYTLELLGSLQGEKPK